MPSAFDQHQFLDVIDRDEAERRFHAVLDLRPLAPEQVPLAEALHRVLAQDMVAPVDVPGFDRANVDGLAVRAADTFGAEEQRPVRLRLNDEELATGVLPRLPVTQGTATAIATGAVIPRGADAVVMVEHTDIRNRELLVKRPVAPGANVTFAGTDIGRSETVLRRGELLTSRETGVLAALGLAKVPVIRRPRVAILSTGDELIEPGQPLHTGLIYDSNATILADAVTELGGEPVRLGIVPDDPAMLRRRLQDALRHDVVLLSGGTSKGAGDFSYRVVAELGEPGIVVHGIALKPGKPLCLAAVGKTPVIVLPGFPTSAIFTFHEFVAPIIRSLAGRREEPKAIVHARLPLRVNSEKGRTEYLLVGLVESPHPGPPPQGGRARWTPSPLGGEGRGGGAARFAAYPMGKGSGSVTTFSRADGFVTIPRQREYLEAGEIVEVKLLGQGMQPADLVVIGSHCVGLDYLLGRLQAQGIRSKFLAVGSSGGLAAARHGECDLAGIHLLDPATGKYNQPFLGDELRLIRGYGRLQGIVFRTGDARFGSRSPQEAVAAALADPACVLINRNRGSGTRILIDGLLGNTRPPGHAVEARSHNAVAAAIVQERADWGVCIETAARDAGLGFIPLQEEQYDFAVPRSRWDRPAVTAFRHLMEQSSVRTDLATMGFRL